MSAINSNASSVAANFSFADLEKSVTGKYNRGELKLDQSGKLAKLNSHVWMTYRNTDVSTVAENIAVRNAVYQSIAKEFGNDGDAAEHLKVAREFLLGDKNFAKPLSRDEVRAIISQLKSITTDLDAAKGDLERLTEQHKRSDDEWTALSKISDNWQKRNMTADVIKKDRRAVKDVRSQYEDARRDFSETFDLFEKKFHALFDGPLKAALENVDPARKESAKSGPDAEALTEITDNIKSTLTWLKEKANQLNGYKGAANDDWSDLSKSFVKVLSQLHEDIQQNIQKFPAYANLLKQLDVDAEFEGDKEPGVSLRDSVEELRKTKKALVEPEHELATDERILAGQRQVDQLAKTRDALRKQIKENPANVEELKARLQNTEDTITQLRRKFGIDDGRAGGTVTSSEIRSLDKRIGKAADRTKELEAQKSAAEKKLADVMARQLSLSDFGKKLRAIRDLKEGVASTTVDRRKQDGTSFQQSDLISGLRAGMGRQTIVQTRTVNERGAGFGTRWHDLPQALHVREGLVHQTEILSAQLRKDLDDELYSILQQHAGQPREQAKIIGEKLPQLLKRLSDGAVDEGMKAALARDAGRLETALQKRLGDIEEDAKPSTDVKNDFRGMLWTANNVLSRFQGADSTPVTLLRERLGTVIADFSAKVSSFKTIETKKVPEKIPTTSLQIMDLVRQKMQAKGAVFTMDAEHVKHRVDSQGIIVDFLRLSEVTREAAKTLVESMEATFPNAADYGTLKELADTVERGMFGFDGFVNTVKEHIKDETAVQALKDAAMEFENVLDADRRWALLPEQALPIAFVDAIEAGQDDYEGKLLLEAPSYPGMVIEVSNDAETTLQTRIKCQTLARVFEKTFEPLLKDSSQLRDFCDVLKDFAAQAEEAGELTADDFLECVETVAFVAEKSGLDEKIVSSIREAGVIMSEW